MQPAGVNYLIALLKQGRVQEFLNLQYEYFDDIEKPLFNEIKKYYDEYGTLPPFELVKGKFQLEDIPKAPFGYFKDEFHKKVIFRQLNGVVNNLTKFLSQRKVTHAVNEIREFLHAVERLQRTSGQDAVTLTELGQLLRDFIQTASCAIDGITGVPSGWPTLDRQTAGFQKGDLYVIAGRVKQGKTQAIIRLALNAYNSGFIPLVVSMEMKALQMAKRIFAMLGQLNMSCMKTGQISSFGEAYLMELISELEQKHPFYFVEGQFRKDTNQLTTLIHSVQPDIVFVDAAYLLKLPFSSRMAKWEKVTEIAEILKTLATTANVPIVVSFQLNREAARAREVGAEHIQLADAISQLASIILAILDKSPLNDYQGIDENCLEDGKYRYVSVLANRDDEPQGFFIHWDWDRMNFSEINIEELEPF